MSKDSGQYSAIKTFLTAHVEVADGGICLSDQVYTDAAQEVAGISADTLSGVNNFNAAYAPAAATVMGIKALELLREDTGLAEVVGNAAMGLGQTASTLTVRERTIPNPKGGDPINYAGHTTVKLRTASPWMTTAKADLGAAAREYFPAND